MISAKIIADSISTGGKRLTTMELVYPRFIHAEFMTHRVFSRNASSSRAIPVAKVIELVRNDPAMPIHWGKNQAGMQANEELDDHHKAEAQGAWLLAAKRAATVAEHMMELGLHKQVANRILEPFQHIHVIVTATEWHNFFELRLHKDAQPEIQELARVMHEAMGVSKPTVLHPGEWHLPYVTAEDRIAILTSSAHSKVKEELLRKISAARCCRVSYLKHDGTKASVQEELALCDRLASARPIHASPFEHQATPDEPMFVLADKGNVGWLQSELHGNFVGWIQYRKQIERSFN